MKIICPYCKQEADKPTGHVNRARSIGAPCYCSKLCSGLARKIERSDEEKKRIKAEYDIKYRAKNIVKITKRKKAFFKKDYAENPEKYRQWRKNKQPKHNEYCRRPEYKAWKKQYDQVFRLKKSYKDFWEPAQVLLNLEKELDSKQIKIDLGIINKSQKRKDKWKQNKNSTPRI